MSFFPLFIVRDMHRERVGSDAQSQALGCIRDDAFMQWLNRGLSVESRMIGPIPEGPHETERDREWTLDLGMGGQG